MKAKILNLLLVLFSLFGYLEWGENQRQFLFQVEGEVLLKMFQDPATLFHPFVSLPLLGQILLVVTLFQKHPKKWLTYAGIGGIGILLTLMLFIGILNSNFKIILSTLPFLITAIFTIWYSRKK